MRAVLNNVISKIKGEDFSFDKNIPLGYIFRLLWCRIISLVWGKIRLRTTKRVFIHPSSKIVCSSKIRYGENLSVGEDCYIDALSKNGLIFGNNVSLGNKTFIRLTGSLKKIATGVVIGNNVGLGTHGYYGCGVGTLEIGDDTICGNYVSVHPENHNYDDLKIPIRLQGVSSKGGIKIGKGCWIGAKVTILDGTIIGNGCIIAAGAVVKGVFPDNVIIGGIPAKILKYRV